MYLNGRTKQTPYPIDAMTQLLHIRSLSFEEMPIPLAWAKQEGWNPGLSDALPFWNADPTGFIGGFIDDRLVACISAIRYGTQFGFMVSTSLMRPIAGRATVCKCGKQHLTTLKAPLASAWMALSLNRTIIENLDSSTPTAMCDSKADCLSARLQPRYPLRNDLFLWQKFLAISFLILTTDTSRRHDRYSLKVGYSSRDMLGWRSCVAMRSAHMVSFGHALSATKSGRSLLSAWIRHTI